MSSRRKLLGVFVVVAAILSVVVLAIALAAGRPADGNGERGTRAVVSRTVTSGNPEVDKFIDYFVTLCLDGDYDQYRLCWTAYAPPISSSRFKAMYDKARRIDITEISPVPNLRDGQQAYLVRASVILSPSARVTQADVDVLVLREDGHWVIAPAPRRETPQDLPAVSVTDSAPASQPN